MRVFLILIGLSISTFSELIAQEETNFLVGGTIGVHFSSYNGSNDQPTQSLSLSATPFAGYFVTKKIALGIGIGLSNTTTKYVDNLNEKISSLDYNISPFVRYYFNTAFFIHGQFNIGESKNTVLINKEVYESFFGPGTSPMELTIHESFTGFGIGLGYDIGISDHVKIEPMIRYIANSRTEKTTDEKYKESKIFINLGFIILL